MYYLKVKDQQYRAHFAKRELKYKLKKFILVSLRMFAFNKQQVTFNKQRLNYALLAIKNNRKNLAKVVRRCVLTNRSKSFQFLKISRLQAKEMIALGVVPGYKKAVW